MRAPLPANEDERLRGLYALGAIDVGRDVALDALAQQALRLFPGALLAAVTLIDQDRQWIKATTDRGLRHMSRQDAFCAHTILRDGVMVVEDTWRDARFADNPLVTGGLGFRFYAGMPLKDQVGALCVLGREPRVVTATERRNLQRLTRAVDERFALHQTIQALTRDVPVG